MLSDIVISFEDEISGSPGESTEGSFLFLHVLIGLFRGETDVSCGVANSQLFLISHNIEDERSRSSKILKRLSLLGLPVLFVCAKSHALTAGVHASSRTSFSLCRVTQCSDPLERCPSSSCSSPSSLCESIFWLLWLVLVWLVGKDDTESTDIVYKIS